MIIIFKRVGVFKLDFLLQASFTCTAYCSTFTEASQRNTKKTKLKEVGNTKITKNHEVDEEALQLFEQLMETLSSDCPNFVIFVVLRGSSWFFVIFVLLSSFNFVFFVVLYDASEKAH